MSEERKCKLHGARAESWCLYHETPLCVTCKFENTHKACPKKTVSTMVDFPITDSRRNLYEECKKMYTPVLEMEKNISSFTEKKPRPVTESLEDIFKILRNQLKSLQDDTAYCVTETESECIRNCNEFKSTANEILKGIGQIMKDLCEDTLDVGRIEEQVKSYKKVADTKLKSFDMCDMEYRIGLKIACLLISEKIPTLRRAILESTLVESLFPVTITNSSIRFIRIIDTKLNPSEKTPVISGCAVLYTGTIVLIDKANSSIKIFSENGLLKNEIKTGSRPHDIASTEQGIWVTFPRLLASQIRFYPDLASRSEDRSKRIEVENGKCFGVEYGGEKLVVSCKISWCKIFGSSLWRFCVFSGKDGGLLQIVEKDKLGKSFNMSDGYFSFCPYRDQISFLSANGKAKQFQLTGPSSLEHLSLLDFKKSQRYKMSTLVSSGGAIITCHKKYKLSLTYKTVINIIGSGKSGKASFSFNGKNPGPMCCDVRSRTIVVCEQPKMFTDRGKTVYVYKF